MNAADLARLELAKRAYRATEPNATEVQRGVRRARLAMRRPKARRRWFSKGLVMVVLAVGSLAYAKPHALSELVSNVLESNKAPSKRGGRGVGAAALTLPPELQPSRALPAAPALKATPTAVELPSVTAVEAPPAQPAPASATESRAAKSRAATPPRITSAAASQAAPADAPTEAQAVSDWGRVGQALARGDETKALAALSELSENGDQRTRDKADIGRAQLLMANGNQDKACSIARELTHRRAGSRIERQAQALLKTCTR